MNTKIRFGLGILGGILVVMGAAFYISHASSATDSSKLITNAAITSHLSSIPNYPAAKDSPLEFVPNAAVTSPHSSMLGFTAAKDSPLEFVPGAVITSQHLTMIGFTAAKDSPSEFIPNAAITSKDPSMEEYFAKDLQLEYSLGAVMVVTASNLSEEAQYFAQDLYTEYSIEDVSEARSPAQGEAHLMININKSSGSLVGQIQSPYSTSGDEPYLSPWPTPSGQIQSPDSTSGDEPYLSPWPITSGQIQSPDSTPGDVLYP
jgi:hypothetical protein